MTENRRRLSIPIPRLYEDVGLGEALARLTAALGISPCPGCRRRAAALDRRAVFRTRRRRAAPPEPTDP